MDFSHFRMLIRNFLNKDTDRIPEENPLIILDSKSAVCMSKNVKYTNHTIYISRRLHSASNGEKLKMRNIL